MAQLFNKSGETTRSWIESKYIFPRLSPLVMEVIYFYRQYVLKSTGKQIINISFQQMFLFSRFIAKYNLKIVQNTCRIVILLKTDFNSRYHFKIHKLLFLRFIFFCFRNRNKIKTLNIKIIVFQHNMITINKFRGSLPLNVLVLVWTV